MGMGLPKGASASLASPSLHLRCGVQRAPKKYQQRGSPARLRISIRRRFLRSAFPTGNTHRRGLKFVPECSLIQIQFLPQRQDFGSPIGLGMSFRIHRRFSIRPSLLNVRSLSNICIVRFRSENDALASAAKSSVE